MHLMNPGRPALLTIWIVVLFACAVLLFGWGMGSEFFIRIFPGYPAMVPGTALTIILAGLGLLALVKRPDLSLPVICGLLIIAVVGLEYLTRFGALTHPVSEKMSPASGFAAILCAVSLLAHAGRPGWLQRLAELAETLGLCLTSLPLLGYLFDSEALWGNLIYTKMALHTALSFFLLFAAALLLNADKNWVRVVLTDGPGGRISRRLLPVIILGPVLFCAIALVATRRDVVTADFRLAVLAFFMVATGVVAVIRAAQQINVMAQKAHQLEHDLQERDLAIARSERIAVLGRLVGGVAHDFNNILSIIIGNLELLDDYPDRAAQKQYALRARKAALNAAALTSQLLAYGRKSMLEPRPMQIDAATHENSGPFQPDFRDEC